MLDFSDFLSFNSELHRITAQLQLCGDCITDVELIITTLSTFSLATTIFSQQYHNMKFQKHFQLMSHLLLAKKHQQLVRFILEYMKLIHPRRKSDLPAILGRHRVNLTNFIIKKVSIINAPEMAILLKHVKHNLPYTNV